MAKVRSNRVIHGLSGMLGMQVVIRKSRTVMCWLPHHTEVKR